MITWFRHNFGLVTAAAAVLTLLVVRWPYFLTACSRNGDYALLALQVELAKDFSLLVGPYSRFGFNHPLPTYSYYYAFFASIFKDVFSWMGNMQFAVYLLNAGLLLWATFLIQCFSRSASKSLLFFACAFYLIHSAHSGMLINIWGPATLLCPLLLILVGLAAFKLGQEANSLLPTRFAGYSVCVAAILLSSNHLTGFVIAFTGLFFLLLQLLFNRPGKLHKLTYINFIVLLIIAFSPILIDVFANFEQSNLFKFLTIQSKQRATIGLTSALWLWLNNFSTSIFLSGYLPGLFLWAALLAQVKYFDKFHKQLFYYLVLLNLVSIFLISKFDEPHLVYLYWFLDALVAVHIYLVLQQLVDLLISQNKFQRWVQMICVVLVFVMLSNIYLSFDRDRQVNCDHSVSKFISNTLDPKRQYVVKIIGPKFPTSAALVVYHLYQQNYDVCVTGFFKHVFGRQLVCASQVSTQPRTLLTVRKVKEVNDYNSQTELIVNQELIKLH